MYEKSDSKKRSRIPSLKLKINLNKTLILKKYVNPLKIRKTLNTQQALKNFTESLTVCDSTSYSVNNDIPEEALFKRNLVRLTINFLISYLPIKI